MNCSYCSTAHIEGRLLSKHSVAYAVDLIRQYASAGIKNFFLWTTPYTALHRIAINERMIRPYEDLLFPKFYMAAELKGWLEEVIAEWIECRENWMR